MARYTYENGIPAGTPGHIFVGWDDLTGEATEATEARNLGKPMPHNWRLTFKGMQPGTTAKLPSGSNLFREY
jgi:hypothetical protein